MLIDRDLFLFASKLSFLTAICLYSVNQIVPASKALDAALSVAQQIIANSPDAVQSTKQGLLISQNQNFHDTLLTHVPSPISTRVYKGQNIKVRVL